MSEPLFPDAPLRVVTVEIQVYGDDDRKAENVVLDLLEREREATDAADLLTWQVTGVEPDWSEEAKRWRA